MDEKKRVFTVLAIDGGGVRGVIPARILEEIETRTGKPIAESFDLITGISTGAILAASLTMPHKDNPKKPRITAAELKKIYIDECPKIFPAKSMYARTKSAFSGALYDSKVLDEHFANTYGDAKLSDSLTNLIIPVIDIKNWQPAYLSNIKTEPDTSPEQWSSMKTQDAIRSAVAAPTYFGTRWVETTPNPETPEITQRHALIDGGFISGNMLPHAYAMAEKLAPADAEIVVVHLGTGSVRREISPDEWNAKGSIKIATDGTLMGLITSIPGEAAVQFMKGLLGDDFITIDSNIDMHKNPNGPSGDMVDALKDNMQRLEKWADQQVVDHEASIARICNIITTRHIAENSFQKSEKAFEALSKMLLDKNTSPGIVRLYDAMVRHMDDPDYKGDDGGTKIRELTANLCDHHKKDLRELYHLLLDKKNHDHTLTGFFNSLVSGVREGLENAHDFLKNAFNGQSEANDNSPASTNEKNKSAGKKKRGWRNGF